MKRENKDNIKQLFDNIMINKKISNYLMIKK